MNNPISSLKPRVWWTDGIGMVTTDEEYATEFNADEPNHPFIKVFDSAYVELLERIVERQSEALIIAANPRAYHAPCLLCGEKNIEHGNYAAKNALNDVQQMCEEFGA